MRVGGCMLIDPLEPMLGEVLRAPLSVRRRTPGVDDGTSGTGVPQLRADPEPRPDAASWKGTLRASSDVHTCDLPARVQRRGLSHSPCEGEPLLWHAHRSDRVKWARIHKHGAAEVCGFVV